MTANPMIMDHHLAESYTSSAQKTRVLSEAWVARSVLCVACGAILQQSRANSKVCDFRCPQCATEYELKAGSKTLEGTIPDGAYDSMMARIMAENAPAFMFLRYRVADYAVTDLLAVPSFAITPAAIRKRTPLKATARRVGWTGCSLFLPNIAASARIAVVTGGVIRPAHVIQAEWQRLGALNRNVSVASRGWLFDVLAVVDSLPPEFALDAVYAHAARLATLHPENQHVEAKIRQQLQRLRDLGYLRFLGAGRYERLRINGTG